MFSILRNPAASVKDLTAAYLQVMKFEEILKAEQTEAKKDLVSSQLDCLQKKPSKDFLSARELLENVTSKIAAVRFGREELKTKIADRLKVESKDRLEQITKELELVASEERKLREAFLSMAAKTVILQERIKGRSSLLSDSQGHVTGGVPSLKVELHLLDSIDGAFYARQIERFRQESGPQSFSQTIAGKRSALVQERDRLERSLQGDSQEEAERLLNRLIPPSAPEPAEAELPKSHPSYESKAFVQDYGAGQGPDYEDGPALPYRGVDEILRDRANS